jgi:hypothetical protein
MANKTQPDWIQKFIDLTHERGRLTLAEAAEISGFTYRTARHYFTSAVLLGNLYRTPKSGAFPSEAHYRAWSAKRRKQWERLRDEAENLPAGAKPYNPARNGVCTECRHSPAMVRVLNFYGVAL